MIQNLANLKALQSYNLFCDEWDNAENLEYNAFMHKTYVDDARKLTSIAPVGNVSIIVLIKEVGVANAITCYTIDAEFEGISNTSDVGALLTDVSALTNSTSFSDNPHVAISLVSVIENIYAQNLATQDEATQFVDNIVGGIIGGADDVVLEGDDIINQLSIIASVTSNEDIVGVDTTTTVLVDTYLPKMFDAIDSFASISTNNETSIQSELYAIAQQSQGLINNLESSLQARLAEVGAAMNLNSSDAAEEISAEVIDNMNNLAQSLVEYATMGASKALMQSAPGESFNYDEVIYNADGSVQYTKSIVATKFDANVIDYNDSSIDIVLPKCGKPEQNIELPLSFMQQQDGEFDCAMMGSSRNNFLSRQNRSQQSETVSIVLFGEGSGSSRRRLIEFETSACFPYLITMALRDPAAVHFNIDMELGEAFEFPSCDFWNTGSTVWDTSGCFVYSVTNSSVTCGCTHLTTFSLSEDDIIPQANILDKLDVKRFSAQNLVAYPTVWLTCFSIFVVFVIICFINPRSKEVQSRSILAFEDIIYKSYQEEMLYDDIVGYEIKYISDYMPNQDYAGQGIKRITASKGAKKSICTMQMKLFSAYLRNEHTLLSVFQRTAGTNFSLKQRLGCFFLYLVNIMMVTGTFYGIAQSNPVKDVFASMIISLMGTIPVTIVKNFFLKSKPLTVESVKHHIEEEDEENSDAGSDIEESKEEEESDGDKPWKDFDMKEFLTKVQKENWSIGRFDAHLGKYYDRNNNEHKIRAMSSIRKILLEQMYPWPHRFKKIGWIMLIVWTLAAVVIAIMYGLSFDMAVTEEANPDNPNAALYAGDCWNTTLALQIEAGLSKKSFVNAFNAQQAENQASYAGSDSASWLLSIFQSLFQSMLLWQPLTAYIITWIKIWLFTWHLKMELGPGNMLKLMKRCCCNKTPHHDDDDDDNDDDDYITPSVSEEDGVPQTHHSYKPSKVVFHDDRPFDLISFLGNSTWMIDDLEPHQEQEQEQEDVDVVVALQSVTTRADQDGESDEASGSGLVSLIDTLMNEIDDEEEGKEEAQTTMDAVDDLDIDALDIEALMDTILEEDKKTNQHQQTDTLNMERLVEAVVSDHDLLQMIDDIVHSSDSDDDALDIGLVLDDVHE
eukprot:486665_1